MARTIIIADDIDGSPDAEEVIFGWDGINWSIDLAAKNRDKLAGLLQPYLDKAHPAQVARADEPRTRAPRGTGTPKTQLTIEDYGRPRRGRASMEEQEYVRNNLVEVNERLKALGEREIDPSDEKMKNRYGL